METAAAAVAEALALALLVEVEQGAMLETVVEGLTAQLMQVRAGQVPLVKTAVQIATMLLAAAGSAYWVKVVAAAVVDRAVLEGLRLQMKTAQFMAAAVRAHTVRMAALVV